MVKWNNNLHVEMPEQSSAAVAVCFFGITRSLSYTLPSIEENVLFPAKRHGILRTYGHFFRQSRIENKRSGEYGELNPEEYRSLGLDQVELEEPEHCLETTAFDEIKSYGDFWQDNFASLRNLFHQLHSLDRVTGMATRDGAQICIFCRPDQTYHDSLDRPILRALHTETPLVQLPYWQPWQGLNDRFAIVTNPKAISAYGERIRRAKDYCESTGLPLHSESLLRYALHNYNIPIRTIAARASRIRSNGRVVDEDFSHPRLSRLNKLFGADITSLLRWSLH